MSFYSTIQNQKSMLFDNLRNIFYFEAIQKFVKKNSIVLDLGAGLGLHGFMANSCGAKKVYLVEPTSILDVTKMVTHANNLTETVESISGKIEDVTLSEKVDVIISVFTGNFLLTEDLLPSLFYARDKYLKPEGKMIPNRAKMVVVPVSAEDYYSKHIDSWSKPIFNIDYSVTRKYAVNSLYYDIPKERKVDFLAKPKNLYDLDFMVATEASCKNTIEFIIIKDSTIHGFLGWFDMQIGDKWLSTSPTKEQTHWSQTFLPLERPIHIKKDEVVSFELKRPEFGEWSWIIKYKGIIQKQSTFLSSPVDVNHLQKQHKNYKGSLSQTGKATQDVLQQINGNNPTSEIVLNILKDYASLFENENQAYKFVNKIVTRYC